MATQSEKSTLPRSLLLFFSIIVIASIIVGYLWHRSLEKAALRHQCANIAAIADLKAGQIVQWRQERLSDALHTQRAFGNSSTFREFLKNPSAGDTRRRLYEWLRAYGSFFKSIFFLDARKRIIRSWGGETGRMGGRVAAYAGEAVVSRNIIFSDFYRDQSMQAACLDIFVPILSRQGRQSSVRAVILLNADPSLFLFPYIQSWPLPSRSAETLLVRREGNEVVILNELRHRKGTALTLRFPMSSKQLVAAMAAAGKEGIIEGLDYRGVPVLAAIKAVPGTSWRLIAKIDKAEVYGPVHEKLWFVTAIILIFILLSAVILGFVWRGQQVKYFRLQYEAEAEKTALTRHYEYLTKYANDIILMINGDLRFVEANEQAVSAYGYSRDELLRMHLPDIRDPELTSDIGDLIEKWDQGESIVFETRHRRKDGTTFPVEVSSRAVMIEDKRFYQGIIRDITERREAEERIENSEANLRIAIEKNPDGIIIVNDEGILQFINPAGEALFGRKAETILGMPMGLPLVSGETTEIDIIVAHGERRVAAMRATPIAWNGKMAFLAALHDITDRKLAEEKMQKTMQRTVQAIAAMSEMKDPYTAGHQRRVAALAGAMAAEMGLSSELIKEIGITGMIHDIGKVSVPAEILSKPGRISDVELSLIKAHVQSGYNILKEIEFPWPVDLIVLQHHERLNGSGYPNGLTDKDILKGAKIIAVADVVEAMAMHRPYRPALGIDAALSEIVKHRDVLYDAGAVEVCVKLFNEKGFKFDA